MKTGALLGVALLAAFIAYCFRQPAAADGLRAPGLVPRGPETLPDRDGETDPTMASPAARTPGSVPPYHEGDPSVRH
jgi:hypothetical protein